MKDEDATRYAVVRYFGDGTLLAERFCSLRSEADTVAANWKRSAVEPVSIGVRSDGFQIWRTLRFERGRWPR